MIRLKTKKKEVRVDIDGLLVAIILLSFGISLTANIGAGQNALADGTYPYIMSGNTITGIDSNYTLSGSLSIPKWIDGVTVEGIGSNAFKNQTGLTSVTIPSTVTEIGSAAFQNCSNLQTVDITSSTNLISHPENYEYTLYYGTSGQPSVATDYLCYDISAYTAYTFYFRLATDSSAGTGDFNLQVSFGTGENSYTTDIVSNSYVRLGRFLEQATTFITQSSYNKLWVKFRLLGGPTGHGLRITDLSLEKGVTDIAVDAFRGCPKLATPDLNYELLPDGTYEASSCPMNPGPTRNILFYPSVHNNKAVTRINGLESVPSGSFADLVKIIANTFTKWIFMQEGMTTIGDAAFAYAVNLLTVDMAQTSIQEIPIYTFMLYNPTATDFVPHSLLLDNPHSPHSLLEGRRTLDNIAFPSTLTTIGESAFQYVGLPITSSLPNSVTTIGTHAFSDAKMLTFRMPNNLTTIGNYAFENSELAIISNIDVGIAHIGDYAFHNAEIYTLNHLPESIQSIGSHAFDNANLSSSFLIGKNSLQTIGSYAFESTEIRSILLSSSVTSVGSYAFRYCSNLTIYTSYTSKPGNWSSSWNSSNRPVFWGCTLGGSNGYVSSFTKTGSNPSNINATNGLNDPIRDEYTFKGWNTVSDGSGTSYGTSELSSVSNNTTLYAQWQKKSCVAEGTLVTLADGSQVAVEDLTGEEDLLVWNLLTGEYDSAPILFIDSDPITTYEIIELTFSDNTQVKVIDEHAFFDMTIGEYVFLRNDAAQYIGHYFNKQNINGTWESVRLVSVDIYDEVTTAWSPVTYGHLCLYVNGMLSMPGATEGLINIFDVDTTSMKFDETQMAEDIATYGLFTYEEFNSVIPLPEFVFDAFNGQYLKVSVGKGLITMGEIVTLLNRYSAFFE